MTSTTQTSDLPTNGQPKPGLDANAELDQQLRDTIRLLGNLLGETLIEQEGRALFDLVEEIRAQTKKRATARPATDAQAEEELTALANDLVSDPPRALAVLKAFTTYFQLVNLAEERQRVYVLRERLRRAHARGTPMSETIAEAVAKLKNEGLSAEEVNALLQDVVIMPVFTAHPTESKRRAILLKLEAIAKGAAPARPRRCAAAGADGRRARDPRNHRGAVAERRDARPPPDGARRGAQRPLLL